MDEYKLHVATRAILEFVLEDLSRWYIQLIRPRTWTEADDPDKLAVYRVLCDVFTIITRMTAPFMPYLSEAIYQNLEGEGAGEKRESIHACDWLAPDEDLIDPELEADMAEVRRIVEAVANARQKAKRKLRWAVRQIVIAPEDGGIARAVESLKDVLAEQTNAQNIVLLGVGNEWDELGIEAIPDMAKLGPAFKKDAGKVADAIRGADARAIKNAIGKTGEWTCDLDVAGNTDGVVTITREMVNFQSVVPEFAADSGFERGIVYVDTTLTPEIEAEGYAAEAIRRIQDMRKELDLEVNDWIKVTLGISDTRVSDFLNSMAGFVAGEVRARMMTIGDMAASGDLVKDWDVEGVEMRIGVSVLA
jgi:isoleucyl-tRNA synthetase